MNILVCMKAVPAVTEVQMDAQFRLQRDHTALQWNIADEAALEAALQLKGTSGTVTVLTMGPKKLEPLIRELYARGADRGILLTDPCMAGADTYATARVLAAAIPALGSFDLILCGSRTIDGETGQVPGMLAGALGIPCVTNVESLKQAGSHLILQRRLEDTATVLEAQLPTVVSICAYGYSLRLPGVLAMRKAKGKQIELLTANQLGLSPEDCGLNGSKTRVVALRTQFPGLRNGIKETDIRTGAAAILKLCREVAP